jgi:predicted PurR-regulated permease PerM
MDIIDPPADRVERTEIADHDVPRWLARGAGWSWRLLAVAAAVALVLYITSHLLVAVAPVVGALFGAAILAPAANVLRRRGWPSLLATWTVFLLAFVFLVGLMWWLIPSVVAQAGNLRETLGHGLAQVRDWLAGPPFHLSKVEVDQLGQRIRSQASGQASLLLHGALAGAHLLVEVVAGILLTIVLTFFFVKDGSALAGWLASFADPVRRERLEGAATLAWQTFTAYVQGTAINGVVNGTLMGVGLTVIGVPLALPIAVFTFFGGFFPLVGGIVSGVIAILVALVAKGAWGAVLVFGLTVLIHHLEGYIVGPVVLGRKVNLHAAVILVALSVGTVLGGVFGAFIAVPVTAISLALIEYYRGLPVAVVASVQAGRDLPRTRLAIVRRVANRRRKSNPDTLAGGYQREATEPGPQPTPPLEP